MQSHLFRKAAGVATLALVLGGCSAESAFLGKSSEDDSDGLFDEDPDLGATPGDESDDDGDGLGESEFEEDDLKLKPAQTDVYVFIANPNRDTVTRINVETLDVRTADVGRRPMAVLTTPDYDHAVVFNQGEDTVSILNSDTMEAVTVEVRDNFNRMVMSPDGNWVALYHDVEVDADPEVTPDGLQSFNELSLVNILDGEHFGMAVGFNPREVKFTSDSGQAVVVSDEQLALVDLDASIPLPNMIQVAEDLVNPPQAEEVVLSPSGRYAFVRQFGASELVVVDLTTEIVNRVPVGANPTDLDLSPDGLRAVVVSRADHELWVLDAEDPFQPPDVLDLPLEQEFGSVLFEPSGNTGIIYTTASPVDRYATWDLATDEITLRSLVKPVRSVAVTPTGESLMVFHTLENAEGADVNSPFYSSWALTLINLTDFRSNPLRLPAEPTGYANSNNGNFGYFVMKNQPFLEMVDYRTLLYEEVRLRSNPVFVGVFPDLDTDDTDEPPAWVSQEHELGRVSFFDPDDLSVETITGFELNSQIED